MSKEQKAVILDYALELQTNDEPWRLFEFKEEDNCWYPCTEKIHPCAMLYSDIFRRKPRTITVTMPVPKEVTGPLLGDDHFVNHIWYQTAADRDTALAAIREAMGDE